MSHVSRPVLIALLAAVAFVGVWFVALRPHGDGSAASTPSAPGVGGLKRAIDKAHGVVDQSNRAAGQQPGATTAAPPRTGSGTPAPTAPRPTPPGTTTVGGDGPNARIARALAAHRVVAILFYNPSAPDDMAVRSSLARADRHGGQVLVLSAPIGDLTHYTAVTSKVAVFGSPSLVIFDGSGQAGVLSGYADPLEINLRIADALGGASASPASENGKSLSAGDFRARARALDRKLGQALHSFTKPADPDEIGPAIQHLEGLARGYVDEFGALAAPRNLAGAHRRLTALDRELLAYMHRYEHRITISKRPLHTYLATRSGYLRGLVSLAHRAAPLERQLRLH
jgi:hypothetical protein